MRVAYECVSCLVACLPTQVRTGSARPRIINKVRGDAGEPGGRMSVLRCSYGISTHLSCDARTAQGHHIAEPRRTVALCPTATHSPTITEVLHDILLLYHHHLSSSLDFQRGSLPYSTPHVTLQNPMPRRQPTYIPIYIYREVKFIERRTNP